MGRLEVCFAGCWGTVCSHSFSRKDAAVACHQLGLPAVGARMFHSNNGLIGPIWLYDLNCTGNELSLFDCPHYHNDNPFSVYRSYVDYNLCDHSADVHVVCLEPTPKCNTGDVRLANGSNEGTVELCLGEQWVTVDGDILWTTDTSCTSTVCKQLGYSPSNATAYISPYSSPAVTNGVVLFGCHCNAWATKLVDCDYYPLYQYQSYIYNDNYRANVVCKATSHSVCSDGSVRLTGGSTQYGGRVEVCAHGSWGGVGCDYWDSRDASVVCNQLGYQSVGPIAYCVYAIDSAPAWLQGLLCTGNEYSFFNCSTTRLPFIDILIGYDFFAAAALCTENSSPQNCSDWDIRLANGPSPSQGRVEVCYKRQWGTICSDWGIEYSSIFANVICRQLGYSYYTSTLYPSSSFGGGSGGIYLHAPSLLCTGNESRLQDCFHPPIGYHWCSDHTLDIGLACQGSSANDTMYTQQCVSGAIHLVGGATNSEGRIEICLGGMWMTVQMWSLWDSRTTMVMCRQLGFPSSNAELVFSGMFGRGSGQTLWLNAECTGEESSVFDCLSEYYDYYQIYEVGTSWNHFYDIGLICKQAPEEQCRNGDVRLVDGIVDPKTVQGRVEVCYGNQWGAVYAYRYGLPWTLREASVVCRQLVKVPLALSAHSSSTDGSQLPERVSFSHFSCTGYEDKLIDCIHGPPGYYWYNEDPLTVSVSCQVSCNQCHHGTVRLVGGNSSYDGRVEVCESGCWGPVCIGDGGWTTREAAVVCKQLQFEPEGAVPRYYYSLPTPPLLTPHCIGNETSVFNCSKSVCHIQNYNYAGVMCSPVKHTSVKLSSATTMWTNSTQSTVLNNTLNNTLAAEAAVCQMTPIITVFSAVLTSLVITFCVLLSCIVLITIRITKKKRPWNNRNLIQLDEYCSGAMVLNECEAYEAVWVSRE